MFYSHTFLARKGPLGTVWCAAHLQERLKKSHYTATDIPSTVDRIMFPEVPIALRMSGHLLLGVVRIYSKKVEYLFHDCKIVLDVLNKYHGSKKLDLKEDVSHAPFQSITLPDTFDLDALILDDDTFEESSDKHTISQEEITLTDQNLIGGNPYVAISFYEDDMMDVMPPEAAPDLEFTSVEEEPFQPVVDADVQMEELNMPTASQDPSPSNQTKVPDTDGGFRDAGPSNQTEPLRATEEFQDPYLNNETEALDSIRENSSSQNFPEIEIRRDPVLDISIEDLPPVCSETVSKTPILNETEIRTPSIDNMATTEGHSLPFQPCSGPPTSAASQELPDISFGLASPQLNIQPSPQEQQPRRRQRAKRRLFDREIVLSNRSMRKALNDCSDLVKKRRKVPLSVLGVWKSSNSLRKEQVFTDPVVTGLCKDISDIFRRDYFSGKPHLAVLEEAVPGRCISSSSTEVLPETRRVQSPAPATEAIQEQSAGHSPASVAENDMEPERLRDAEGNVGDNLLHEILPSPARSMHSPFRKDGFTPLFTKSLGSELAPQSGLLTETTVPTPDFAASAGTHGSGLETPRSFLDEQVGLDNSGLSDIPEVMGSTEVDDLCFLEAENDTPSVSQASQGVDSLSVRTRALAQYLRRHHSPITPVSENTSPELSLNKILEGKTRKLCARMFFETLVLKSNGLIDVRQEEPYGDINVKLTNRLSKAQL